MSQLPLVGLQSQLLRIHGNTGTPCQLLHNIEVLLLGGLGVIDGNTETVDQRQLLLYRIGMMSVVGIILIVAVIPALLNEVAPVGGSIDQNILRLRLHAALDDCL